MSPSVFLLKRDAVALPYTVEVPCQHSPGSVGSITIDASYAVTHAHTAEETESITVASALAGVQTCACLHFALDHVVDTNYDLISALGAYDHTLVYTPAWLSDNVLLLKLPYHSSTVPLDRQELCRQAHWLLSSRPRVPFAVNSDLHRCFGTPVAGKPAETTLLVRAQDAVVIWRGKMKAHSTLWAATAGPCHPLGWLGRGAGLATLVARQRLREDSLWALEACRG